MLNRRILRVKVFQTLYSYWQDEHADTNVHEKNLLHALQRTYDIYYWLMAFPIDLKHVVEMELDMQKAKHFTVAAEIDLHEIIISNRFIALLEKEERLRKPKLSWDVHKDLLRSLFIEFKKDETFLAHIQKAERNFNDDRKIIQYFLNELIEKSEAFNQTMEDHYISWTDDKQVIMNSVNKSFRLAREEEENGNFLMEPNDEFREFCSYAKNLFRKTVLHQQELEQLIMAKTQNWDVERIARTDTILLKMALCEILHFPEIPVKVSINEYIEVSKVYSTPQSSNFVNGILDSIRKELKTAGKIKKEGRGLIE